MGNNNATPSLKEEESSKLENKGKSPLESGSVETTQGQVLLATEGKDGNRDKEKENLPDGKKGEGTSETEPQRHELVEDPKAKNVDKVIHQSGLMETDEKLQKHTSVSEASRVEIVTEATKVEEVSMVETQSVVSKLNTTEFGNEEKKTLAIDETVIASPSFDKTDGTEKEKMVNESLKVIVPANEVVKLDQETDLEQSKKFPEAEPQEILDQDTRLVVDNDVTIEAKADQVVSKESSAIQEIDIGVYKEENAMETGREASLETTSRSISISVSHDSKITGESQVQQLVSEVPSPSRNKTDLEKTNTLETTLHVSCLESNKPKETTEAVTETNKETTEAPGFGGDLRTKERSNESTEKTPLLLRQDKTETYETTIGVEESTVMLKRSESVKTKAIELSPELSMKPKEKSEADDSLKENKGSEDNLLDKKASMRGRVKKRSKSTSILGTCLCCATTMN